MISKTVSLTTKISGQIAAEIQENLARLLSRKAETHPQFKEETNKT